MGNVRSKGRHFDVETSTLKVFKKSDVSLMQRNDVLRISIVLKNTGRGFDLIGVDSTSVFSPGCFVYRLEIKVVYTAEA